MKEQEARELCKELGNAHPWWYFEEKRLEESPYWYIKAQNKISGVEEKFYIKPEPRQIQDKLGVDYEYSRHVNNPIEACIHLSHVLRDLKYRLHCLEEINEQKRKEEDDRHQELGIRRRTG